MSFTSSVVAASPWVRHSSVPVVGEDDTYPKDRKGRPTDTVKLGKFRGCLTDSFTFERRTLNTN